MNINELIKKRRSIFPTMYSGEKVEDSIVNQMLENAHWAPSHKRTFPWYFNVYSGPSLGELANFQSELYKKKTEEEGTFSEANYKKMKTKPLLASHIIAIGMKRDPKESVPEIEEIEAVACAVENMYLTAAAYEIGVYWGSGGITYWKEANSFFGLGEKDILLGFMYIGKPKDEKWPLGNRPNIKDHVRWN